MKNLTTSLLIIFLTCQTLNAQQWSIINNNNIWALNTGNVGIGTTNPMAKLDVKRLDRSNTIDPTAAIIKFIGYDYGLFSGALAGPDIWGTWIQSMNENGYTMPLLLNPNGSNVGIGTTNPKAKLDVKRLDRSNTINPTTAITKFIGYDYGLFSGTLAGPNIWGTWIQSMSETGTNMPLLLNPNDGNVGIGTTNPKAKLDVKRLDRSNTINPTTAIAKFIGYDYGLFSGTLAGPNIWGTWVQSMNENGSTVPLLLNPNGSNVGIGTTNPKAKLDVIGGRSNIISVNTAVTKLLGVDYGFYLGTLAGPDIWGTWIQSMRDRDGLSLPLLLNPQGGNIGINTKNPKNLLDVNGTIHAKEILIDENNWSDFVFDSNYTLPSLQEVHDFILTNKHLPNIPSAEDVKTNGINITEMQAKLLQKVEELTLYVIEQNKKIEELQQAIKQK